jgi:hypothetical protein
MLKPLAYHCILWLALQFPDQFLATRRYVLPELSFWPHQHDFHVISVVLRFVTLWEWQLCFAAKYILGAQSVRFIQSKTVAGWGPYIHASLFMTCSYTWTRVDPRWVSLHTCWKVTGNMLNCDKLNTSTGSTDWFSSSSVYHIHMKNRAIEILNIIIIISCW